MQQSIGYVSLVVRDYDEALAFFIGILDFELVEDTYVPEQDKRWVLVAPRGSREARLVLAKASKHEQAGRIGNQTGGRVFLFLHTDDFWRDYQRLQSKGVVFRRPPKDEPYGTVAAFNAALALELLVKAVFLATAPHQPRRVYTHHVAELLPEHLLAPDQRELLQKVVRRVRWSGRYPTPLWTSEGWRREWDLKVLEDGSIDGGSIPNSTGIDEVAALIGLFEALWPSYTAPADAMQRSR